MRLLVVGLDPGTTVAYCLLGLDGELVELSSSKQKPLQSVVAEIFKQIRNSGLPITFYHLRTHDGREVDLLLELEEGFVAIEIKMADKVHAADTRPLRNLDQFLDKPILSSLILSMDHDSRKLSDSIIALPAVWALSPDL